MAQAAARNRNARRRSAKKANPVEAIEISRETPNAASAVEMDHARAAAIGEAIRSEFARLKGARLEDRDDAARLKTRVSLVYPADQVGLQRIVGERDIVQV